jgi:hypothetical protein
MGSANLYGYEAVDPTEIEEPASSLDKSIGHHRHYQPYYNGEEKLAGDVDKDIAEVLRLSFRFVCPLHAVSPLVPSLIIGC